METRDGEKGRKAGEYELISFLAMYISVRACCRSVASAIRSVLVGISIFVQIRRPAIEHLPHLLNRWKRAPIRLVEDVMLSGYVTITLQMEDVL